MEREKSIEIENLQARWGWDRAGWWQISWTRMYTLEYAHRLALCSSSLWQGQSSVDSEFSLVKGVTKVTINLEFWLLLLPLFQSQSPS